jgi:hypothetical protein
MDREQILDLYEWRPGICFRHPCKGKVPTARVGLVVLPDKGGHEVRACGDCVIALDDMKRESSSRSTGKCQATE